MKKKVLAVIMALVLVVAMSAATVQPALAQEAEAADFSVIAGCWESADSESETLTITEDGLFIYINGDMDSQGYLEYVDEYEDGNGRYDMYNREGVWLAGIYQDSEDSLHMGNDEGIVFTRTEEYREEIAEEQWDVSQGPSCVLTCGLQYTGMVPLRNDSSWNGGYYYADMTEDGITVIVNCCAANGTDEYVTSPEYREVFAEMVSGSEVMDYEDGQNQYLTQKFSYPVYDLSFTTGGNEDTCVWKMILFQTDTYTYAYAFKMYADFAEDMEGEYWYSLDTLEMLDLSGYEIEEPDYDPSAEGESLEDFIAYFDTWHLYGDLNQESIRIYGDGTWAYYNAIEEDGTGGYLFDDGTFETFGTNALMLYSADGTYVADVSLNEYGDLALTPVLEGYGIFDGVTIFIRESECTGYTVYVDDDPSAEPVSLEDLITFFDGWYLCGDLNAESIYIYGDGSWIFYNAIEADGTGGYVFDEGTFEAIGTIGLQLYSADGSHVADVSMNEFGELVLTPVVEGYADFYGDTIFDRESESVAYEAQDADF